ncbi:hypothetical protein ACN2WE_03770 [Streptomyces sp. cg28]|uniref:hypothetical protein n=1 Tax=Streptomyces sp. cg28 TaxID=3403457 RepID=UPI003B21DC86
MSTSTQSQNKEGWSVIPVLCFVRKPGDTLRCTLAAGHHSDHLHAYTRTSWPHRSGEKQAD